MEGIPFRPTGKYSPIQIFEFDGYANGQPDNGTPATHDASSGAVPSYTTAKRASLCVVTVAGTLGGAAVSVNDYLIANRDNPTAAAHWDIVRDCTAEFEAAVAAAQGAVLRLDGTYLIKNANVVPRLTGLATILNLCGYPAIYTELNNAKAALNTPRAVASAGIGVGQGQDIDDDLGSKLQQTTYFTLATPAHAADFPMGSRAEVFTDAIHPAEDGTAKGYISNVFTVVSVDTTTGTVYADRVIKYHNEIANATNIVIVPLRSDCAARIDRGIVFMGGPTVIGGEVGWWLTLDGSNPITATISGSGDTRTLTVAGGVPSYLVGQACRVIVDADSTFTMKVTATTATTITGTVPKDGATYENDRNAAESAPTSGSVTFVPGFWTSEFDSTTHGGTLVLQQAHGSVINCDIYRPWSAGVRVRFSHFCDITVRGGKAVNIGTGINTRSWRLLYGVENYCASRNRIRIYGDGWRHPYTTGTGATSVAWASGHWVYRSGCTCENEVDIYSVGATGPASDTHAMTNGDRIVSVALFIASWNTAHSYRGIGGQARGENHIIDHTQVGGQIGFRIANGSDYARVGGSVDDLTLDISDLPMRPDSHCFTVASPSDGRNTPCGLYVMSQAGYTGGAAGERTKFVGSMKMRNAGASFILESYATGSMKEIAHADVGYAGGWLQNQSKLHVDSIHLDYSLANGVETAHTGGSVALGTGVKSFTVGTGLGIAPGLDVLLEDTTTALTPRANFGWGRVVSYNSGTGALSVYVDGYKGAATVSTWRATVGAKNPRYGIVMSGASTFTFDVMHWKVGEGANPLGIFRSRDATGGKIVKGGILIISDPNNYGMPYLIEDGRDADFNMNIGTVIYNGVALNANFRPDLQSGRILVPPVSLNSIGSFTHNTASLYATPVHVKKRTLFSAVGFGVHTSCTNLNVKVGVYKDSGGIPGALVTGSTATGGPYTDAADTSHTVAFAANLALEPGWYWLAIQTDQNQALKAISTVAAVALLGADDMVQGGGRVSVANTYASGMPSTFGTPTWTANGGPTYLGLLKA